DHGERRWIQPRACDHSRFQHHHCHRRRGAVLHRHRASARLRRDPRHRHHHHRVHRVHPHAPHRGVVGAAVAAALRADLTSGSRGPAVLPHCRRPRHPRGGVPPPPFPPHPPPAPPAL